MKLKLETKIPGVESLGFLIAGASCVCGVTLRYVRFMMRWVPKIVVDILIYMLKIDNEPKNTDEKGQIGNILKARFGEMYLENQGG